MYRPATGSLKSQIVIGICALSSPGLAQGSLTFDEAVRLGIEASPQVKAAEAEVQAAEAGIRRARAGFLPQVELAPGAGFTNGNTALSQRFDISGVTSARESAAKAEMEVALSRLTITRQQAAYRVGLAYFESSRAKAELAAARELADLAARFADLVRKRVEVGEAPQVQASRAGLEATRAAQDVVRATGDVRARLAALKTLTGRQEISAEDISELAAVWHWTGTDFFAAAFQRRGEIMEAKAAIAVARAEARVVTAERGPILSAGVAADTWSIDRDPFQSRNLGLQTFLSFPLFDKGAFRAEAQRGQAIIRAAEARVREVESLIRIELSKALEEREARAQVAESYRSQILPEAKLVVEATQKGFETGVSTLLDVLDAQRTLRLVTSEALRAQFDALSADLELRRAAGQLAPRPQPETKN